MRGARRAMRDDLGMLSHSEVVLRWHTRVASRPSLMYDTVRLSVALLLKCVQTDGSAKARRLPDSTCAAAPLLRSRSWTFQHIELCRARLLPSPR